jgi:hypothetical protein
VSEAVHARRLRRMERTRGAKDNEWLTALREIDRQQRAALALVKFAQALAGLPPPAPVPPREETSPCVEPVAAPPPQNRARVWGPNNRPGVHDVLTWEEVMRLPWIEGDESVL